MVGFFHRPDPAEVRKTALERLALTIEKLRVDKVIVGDRDEIVRDLRARAQNVGADQKERDVREE